jgi:prolyl oligopeptidase
MKILSYRHNSLVKLKYSVIITNSIVFCLNQEDADGCTCLLGQSHGLSKQEIIVKRIIIVTILMALSLPITAVEQPATPKALVTDIYHGVKVSENYRWLENWDDPKVKQWSDAQNAYARDILDNLPNITRLRERITNIMKAETTSYHSLCCNSGHLFAEKHQPPKQQNFIIIMDSPHDASSERILVDPSVVDPSGSTSIDWFVPSFDGKYVAVSMSKGGTESGDVCIYETATGEQVYEVIPRVNGGTAGGDVAWVPDNSGFFYTRYPRGNERPLEDQDFYQQVYYHELGTPTEDDRYEIGKDFPRIAAIRLDMDKRTGRVLVTVQNGDGGEFAHYLRSPDGTWKQFSWYGDKTIQVSFGFNNDLFIVSLKDAPRGKILRMKVNNLDVSKAKTIVLEGQDTIVADNFYYDVSVLPTESVLYVVYQLGGPSEIRAFDHNGKARPKPTQLNVSSVSGLTIWNHNDILFGNSSFIDPPAFYLYEAAKNKTTKTELATNSPVNYDDTKVIREFAISKDGTRIPVNIIIRKDAKLNGANPCIVNGYGGYGVSLSPRYYSRRRVLLDNGFIFVVANIRGGGEYGEQWHLQGNLTNKQNVFDDFAAAIRHMIERNYTNSQKLATIGGSNGGTLMAATFTQNPDLVSAVVSVVGVYDKLRDELSPNGAFNVTEFGTVKNQDHFEALYAYSPYHNVKNETKYPAILFLTGANDPRVDPMQSRKMTARLQEASKGDNPILLRTSANIGHGAGIPLNERIEMFVDIYAFLFNYLDVTF